MGVNIMEPASAKILALRKSPIKGGSQMELPVAIPGRLKNGIDRRHTNGECWPDETGRPIQAHGAGILFHKGVYYWYGEHRDGPDFHYDGRNRRFIAGVGCWKSNDLVRWESVGIVLPVNDDPTSDLHRARVLERPKVIYNPSTAKFILWLHVDTSDYKYSRAGVAVSDSPEGPFQYIQSFGPNTFMSRDMTLFVDREGCAYHIGSSDNNATTMISCLSDDWLKPSGIFRKVFERRWMEAFAFCEHGGRYWMIASGCTGWNPNPARSAVADDFMGPWMELPNPCVGENAEITFGGQSCFILPPGPVNHDYIAMFDVWRPASLSQSGYAWLPIHWENDRMVIRNQLTWPPIVIDH